MNASIIYLIVWATIAFILYFHQAYTGVFNEPDNAGGYSDGDILVIVFLANSISLWDYIYHCVWNNMDCLFAY